MPLWLRCATAAAFFVACKKRRCMATQTTTACSFYSKYVSPFSVHQLSKSKTVTGTYRCRTARADRTFRSAITVLTALAKVRTLIRPFVSLVPLYIFYSLFSLLCQIFTLKFVDFAIFPSCQCIFLYHV